MDRIFLLSAGAGALILLLILMLLWTVRIGPRQFTIEELQQTNGGCVCLPNGPEPACCFD